MSNAKKCDRCGKYYPHPGLNGQYVTVVNDKWKMAGECFDLCDECMRKLVKWLEGEVEK